MPTTDASRTGYVVHSMQIDCLKNLKDLEEILEFVELTNDADRYAKEYSGGMIQRIGLAVAFLTNADIFLLDENGIHSNYTDIADIFYQACF